MTSAAEGRIPIIDLEAGAARAALAIRAACVERGAFHVRGHGVPLGLVREQFEAARRFFALPQQAKDALDWAKSDCRRGYKKRTKESFYIGREFHGPNQWPADAPGFRPVTEAYFYAMHRLSGRLMRLLALSLELAPDHFEPLRREPMPVLRLIRYPRHAGQTPGGPSAGARRANRGTVTVVARDDAEDGGPETFLVQLGELFVRWSGGLYRPGVLRAPDPAGGERYAAAFFANPDPEHIEGLLATTVTAAGSSGR